MTATGSRLLVIACGALAREITQWRRSHPECHVDVQCLDAALHNHPERIPNAVDALICQHQPHYERVFVAYGDCGTGGRLDAVLANRQVERLTGAHCYSVFATEDGFDALASQEPGTFYLTDFLVRHFDRLVIKGLKLDQHPALRKQLFAHYRRVVYLAQTDDPVLQAAAEKAAAQLDLTLETVFTGLGQLAGELETQVLRLTSQSEGHHATH